MRTFFVVSKAIVFSLLMFCACFAYAESPFTRPKNERYRIDFFYKPEWAEVSRIEETPERLVITLVGATNRPIDIASFMQDGDAVPELVSVFKEKVRACAMLFLIVKWHYYIPGSATEGDYFEVHAYGVPPHPRDQRKLIESRSLTKYIGSGFDGRKEGRYVHFRFKDADAVHQALMIIDNGRGNSASASEDKDCNSLR